MGAARVSGKKKPRRSGAEWVGVVPVTYRAKLLRTRGQQQKAPPERGLPETRLSDHASFWDAGLPAVMITDTAFFRNSALHRVLKVAVEKLWIASRDVRS